MNGAIVPRLVITPLVNFGDTDNNVAVKVDNGDLRDEASHIPFEWESRDLNGNEGGINCRVRSDIARTI